MKLNAQMDQHGILRSNGLLCYAKDLPYAVRHPIILPKRHAVTRLVITDVHERLGHETGVENLLTEFRARFWIVKGKRNVRRITESCGECRRRFSAKPACQMMAPLPKSRITQPLKACRNRLWGFILNKARAWETSKMLLVSFHMSCYSSSTSGTSLWTRHRLFY